MKLIFIYNANSGTINALLDSAHKIISPSTYDCKLCELTFGAFSEKKVWKSFRESSAAEMIFLHKDEFLKQYRSKWLPKYDFPIILTKENGHLEALISRDDLEGIENERELIKKLENYIE